MDFEVIQTKKLRHISPAAVFCLNEMYGNLLLQFLISINREIAQLFQDTEELVVLGHAVGAAQRTGLDLAAVGGHGDVGDGGVLGLARAVAGDGGVAVTVGHVDGVQGLAQRADLVHLN